MWCNLFYDKCAPINDHHFSNPNTKDVTIEDLDDGSYQVYYGDDALTFNNSKFTGNFQIPDVLSHKDLYELRMYSKFVNGIEAIFTVVSINSTTLEELVSTKKAIPGVDFLKNLCRYHLSYTDSNRIQAATYSNNASKSKIDTNREFIVKNAMTCVDYAIDNTISQPPEIVESLYGYQRASIYWMANKEQEKKVVAYNMNEEVIIGNVFFDVYNQSFNLMKNRKTLEFSGGGLIDEVGLGKTLQMITLALKNPSSQTSFVLDNDKTKFYSKATLVLCPNQLCGQWFRELKKMISPSFDPVIIQLVTKRDFDRYTYQDLLDADFVIVSYTFLDNKVFTNPWTSKVSKLQSFHKQKWSQQDNIDIASTFTSMGTALLKDPISSLNQTGPLIQLIWWHRLAVDEFHEVYSNAKYVYIKNLLPYLKSTYRWVVTATPFIIPTSLYNAVDFISGFKNDEGEKILTIDKFVDYCSTDCFRRNTKDSVKNEYKLPPIKEEVIWLKFSTTERMMYNAYIANPNNDKFSVYLRQLCCHPQLADETKHALSNCKSLKDIEKMMVAHYQDDANKAQEKVDLLNVRIKKVNKKIRKIEKKQRKALRKKFQKKGAKDESSSESESDSDGDDTSDDDDDLALLIAGIDNDDDTVAGSGASAGGGYGVPKPSVTLDNLKDSLQKLEYKLKDATKELDGKKTTLNFFVNVVDRLRNTVAKEGVKEGEGEKKVVEVVSASADTNVMNMLANKYDSEDDEDLSDDEDNDDEECGICLDVIPEDDVGVTKCGHIFCFSCLKAVICKYYNCPYCKKALKESDIFILSYEMKKKKAIVSPEDKKKEALIDEVGTKLANLIFYVKKMDEHTIIFSQWDDLLRKVGRILDENGIKNMFCKGNVYQRDKAIREFNDNDKIKVIMLSSESAASGTNLTKATQVIMLDPIYGAYKYRKDQERQAIGRAHRLGQKKNIRVVRFIIRGSVEEEIHMMNIQEDKKHVDSKDFEEQVEITVE